MKKSAVSLSVHLVVNICSVNAPRLFKLNLANMIAFLMSRASVTEIVFARRRINTLKAACSNGTSVHWEQMINYSGG